MLVKSRIVRLEERLPMAGGTEGRAIGRLPMGATRRGQRIFQGGGMPSGLQAIGTSPRLLSPWCDWKN